ncbi:MAG: hypothetical protein ABIH42_01250, partial [Planctomycetota bacterium]
SSRNKGHRKNFGENALDVNGVISKFEGRGDIKDAFVFAMKDLEKAIGSLSEKQRKKIFSEGEKFMNLEIVWPAAANVINYDKAVLQFHGSVQYNSKGDPQEYIKSDAKALEEMIRKVNHHVQKHFEIVKPYFLKVPKHKDFSAKRDYFLSKLGKLQKQYSLSDDDTLGMYHQRYWENAVLDSAKQYKYEVPLGVLMGLVKRWAFFDKSYSIRDMSRDIDNETFLEWVLKFDKEDHKKQMKENIKPFEILFFELGAEVLSNMEGFLASNPDKTVQKIRDDIAKDIKNIRRGKDIEKLGILRRHLDKINAYGGFDKIVPSEGLIFSYGGKIFKISGNFGPINQIKGLLKFR